MSDGRERWAEMCSAEQFLAVDFDALCEERTDDGASPIDDFYAYLTKLIPVGTLEQLDANPALGHTLLLGMVSGTELYFRRILATLINICPLCRRVAARQQLALGAVDYYGSELGFGLLENVSIAGSGELRRQTSRILGIELPKGSSVEQAVSEFEKLCELRHAATHSRGHLGHQNLRDLGIEPRRRRMSLIVGVAQLHTAASVCQNVVRAYNRFLYRAVIERWIAARLLTGKWPKDRGRFTPMLRLFHSVRDFPEAESANELYRSLQPIVKRALVKAAARGDAAQQGVAADGASPRS